MKQLLKNNPLVLMEGAIIEPMRRSGNVQLHEALANAPLIYDAASRRIMASIYQGYMKIAMAARLPMILCSPTWRTNRERVEASGASRAINENAVHFLKELRDTTAGNDSTIKIGGMSGCKNDCYRPEEGLSADEAQQFHAWQIERLATGGADFLLSETLPNTNEALGIARAMQETDLPYIISFVISRRGCILDGIPLLEAIDRIDSGTNRPPLGYMVNCAYPSFLSPARQPPELFHRLIGFQANASSLDHCDLDQATHLQADRVSDWGNRMLELNQTYGMKILGGCCGTEPLHLQYLVDHRKSERS